ncbi:MAG: A/G-specific adenine glycosylase [Tepidiformaceae bacterium]
MLVSEVMLQQTQVERVLPYYERWLARWPGIEELAAASPADAIRQWAGLGYNRRALSLHRVARTALAEGGLPRTADGLGTLPGVGRYTASAVAAFAFDARLALVETNIARVIARLVLGMAVADAAPPGAVRRAANALLPARNARAHNLALMDLGALICRPRAPLCDACPVRACCRWRAASYPASERRMPAKPPFEDTSRFARGRIVAALLAGPAELEELAAGLASLHRPKLAGYLAALEGEGLIERAEGAWRLPTGPQGSTSIASPKL